MKHFYKLLFALFLLPLFTMAQSHYKAGYVVTLKGDTLHGFIDFQEWDSNPTAISFKSVVSDPAPQRFTTSNISFFNVDGLATNKKYVCSISMDVTNTGYIGEGRDTSFKIDTVFLQILQKGRNLALYSYRDNVKTRFYIGETPGYIPTELTYRLYFDRDATNIPGNTVNENTYQKQLFALAIKYNALDDKLTAMLENSFTSYNKDDLLAIVSRINNISKAEFEKKYTEHSKFNFYVSAALNISRTSSSSVSSYTAGGGRAYTSYLPAVSFGINVTPNPNAGKVELRGEISFAESQFNSSYQLTVSPYTAVKATYDQLGVSIAPQIIYNFYNAENFKIYAGAGVAFIHFIYSNSFFGSQNPNVSDNGVGETDPYNFEANDTSFLLTAGAKFNKKFAIFAKYFSPMPTTNSGYFQFNTTNEQIGIIYLLGK
ncbi:MAG TPA: hypothetical protein VIM16_04865 [Mucilaginibacter sp.]|jgi:hypothetical protein